MGSPAQTTPSNSNSSSWSHYYNPFHYARSSRHPPVYSRDFAYANNAPQVLRLPMRAERGNIIGTSAKTFAEYVLPISLH